MEIAGVKAFGSSHRTCYICRDTIKSGCKNIPAKARIQLLITHKLFAPEDSRICASHLRDDNSLHDIEVSPGCRRERPVNFNTEDSSILIQQMMETMREAYGTAHMDFNTLSDSEFQLWTGWQKENINNMLGYLRDMRDTNVRNKINALGIFWLKLKTDLSYDQISALFGFKHKSNIQIIIESVRNNLNKYFVPSYLYPEHLSRQMAKSHSTIFSITFW